LPFEDISNGGWHLIGLAVAQNQLGRIVGFNPFGSSPKLPLRRERS
jgi:hypothetical protein